MNELGQFVQHQSDFDKLGVEIVAISVDPIAQGREVQQKLHARFTILSDANLTAMHLYGTESPQYKNSDGVDINTPTLLLIDRQGVIRWIQQAVDHRVRAPVATVLAAAARVQ